MKTKTTIIALLFIAFTGCEQVIETTSLYNPNDAAYIHEDGSAVIEGQAFLRTVIGEVRTCAGSEVLLLPVTEYSAERMWITYGNISGGRSLEDQKPDDPDPRYWRDALYSMCDAEGDFLFTGVPPGEYFITSSVWWEAPQSAYYSSTEGADLMKRIKVIGTDDEYIRVLLH